LVFIGIKMDREALIACLDACLLTDEEVEAGESAWATLPDPFTPWEDYEIDHSAHLKATSEHEF
jgi:hypothetical protein